MAFSFAPQLAFLAGPLGAISARRQYTSVSRFRTTEGSESLRLRDFSFVFYPLLSPLTALEPLSADGAPHGRSFSEQMSDIFSVQSLTFLRRGIIYTKLAP